MRHRITLMIVVLLFMSILIIGGIVYNQSKHLILDSIGEQIMIILEKAEKLIDPVKYKNLIENGDEDSAYYMELRILLNDLREKTGLLYLYTMEKVDGTYYYMVDGWPLADDEASGFKEEEDWENISTSMEEAVAGKRVIGDLSDTDWGKLLSAYVPILGPDGEILGILGADFPAERVYSVLDESTAVIIWSLIVIVVVSGIFAYFLAWRISKPLEKLSYISTSVRNGDLSISVEKIDRNDEIGDLYLSFDKMIQNLRSLVQTIQIKYKDLINGVQILNESTESAGNSILTISSSVNDVARGSEYQLSNLSNAAIEVATMASHIQQIEGNSEEASSLSSEAEKRALEGRQVLTLVKKQTNQIDQQATNSANIIRSLGDKINEVTGFVKIISAIAEQTNLLALNAAIESARAGEEGRGFAVVAKEIRDLAEESASSAKNVAKTINEIYQHSQEAVKAIEKTVDEVKSGVSAINNAEKEFESVLETNKSVKQNIKKVTEAITSISGVSQEIKKGMDGVSALSQEVNATAEEVNTIVDREEESIQNILDQSKMLVQLAKDLQEEIQKFRL
ncbi:MAG: HAMP domain-containing protein [Halanaerobiales bacterium]|nr:HAMP domain-containing protein [Halanaerobiales bacterium]